jgi:thiol-disulfide isomerase/thioredoxin
MRRFAVLATALTLPAVLVLVLAPGRAADPPAKIEVTEVKYDQLDKAVADQKGKVVLLDFWATWCAPCVKKFPHFVATQNKYKDKGLVCFSVSFDPDGPKGSYDKEKVLKFLTEKGAAFPNFIVTDYKQTDEKFSKRFGLEGGIPFQVLFGKDGKKVWDSEAKELKDEEIDKLIEAELAK